MGKTVTIEKINGKYRWEEHDFEKQCIMTVYKGSRNCDPFYTLIEEFPRLSLERLTAYADAIFALERKEGTLSDVRKMIKLAGMLGVNVHIRHH